MMMPRAMMDRVKHMPLRRFRLVIPFLLLMGIGAFSPSPVGADTAVIINTENTVSSVTGGELKQIYLGEITRWEFASQSKERIELVDCKGKFEWVGSYYKKATGMSVMRLRTQWFGMVFRGEVPDLPKAVKSPEEIVALVADNPNSIGFVDAAFLKPVPARIKILKIDSKAPGDSGYLFP